MALGNNTSKYGAFIDANGNTIFDDVISHNRAIDKLRGKRVYITITESKPTRSNEQNRYMRAMYKNYLVPDYFDTEDEAHDYYTEKFLSQVDVLDLNDDSDFMEKLNEISRQARVVTRKKYLGDKVEITWVRSTSALKTTEMEDFLTKFRTDVQMELGVTVPLPNQVEY